MKVAIVKGWAGVMAQKRAWQLEREAELLEAAIGRHRTAIVRAENRLVVLKRDAKAAQLLAEKGGA